MSFVRQMYSFLYGNGNWKITVSIIAILIIAYSIPKLRVFFKSVGESKKREKASK